MTDEQIEDDFGRMLWDWFASEERCGAQYMNDSFGLDGVSVDDFKGLLDEHETALVEDIEKRGSEITSLRSVLQSVLVDPPADSDEPDDDATALVKIRGMVRSALDEGRT